MSTALEPTPGRGPAESDELEDGAGQTNQFVTFSVAGELFAVPMAPVQEIIRVPEVAQLPLAPRTLDGLANLRGRVLPIINLRRLFGCEERPNDDATRALVINLGQPLGFVVDRVASVVTIEPGEIESADSIQTIVSADYLTGVIKRARPGGGHDMLLSIDFAKLTEGQFGHVGGGAASTDRGAALAGTAANAAQADGGDVAASDELRLVSFSVADQEYALDIAEVQEIVQLPEQVNELPNTPAHVLGVMSLRQRLLPLVSLRTLFGLPRLPYAEQHRIVVTALPGGLNVGLVTDSVKEVLSVPKAQSEPMPGMLAADSQLDEFSSICRLDGGKRLVSIIATDRLLRMPAIETALEAARAAGGASVQETAMHTDPGDDEIATDDDTQVVIFRLGAEEFGVPIMSVQEIVRVPETLTRVPRTPPFVEGVINLRGTVLPVIDQRSRLGLAGIERNDRQRIMVYLLNGMRTGFIVDSVAEVLRIPRGHIVAAPAMSDEQSQLIRRVANLQGDKRMVMLIDPQHLLQAREVRDMQQLGAAATEEVRLPKARVMKKVLVVDDSALMRKLLTGVLVDGGYGVRSARNGAEAVEAVVEWQPDVVTLDINMPEMDGLTALSLIMSARPTPVVMVSSLTEKGALATFEALALGAVDFIPKPGGTISLHVDEIKAMLLEKVRSASRARLGGRAAAVRPAAPIRPVRPVVATPSPKPAYGKPGLVLIGVSTGGPRTLEDILPKLSAQFPWPVLVAQHMPANFTETFARRMDTLCAVKVVEVAAPMPLEAGTVYIGRGGTDLTVTDRAGTLYAAPRPETPGVLWHPSVEVMVESALRHLPATKLVGVMLTGMGDDGAAAMAKLHAAGGKTIAESADTAVVFGMPAELIERRGASMVLPCTGIAAQLRIWLQ